MLKTLLFSLQDITFQLPLIGFDLLPEEEDNPDLDVDDVGETVSNEMPTLGVPAQIRLIVRSMFSAFIVSLVPFPHFFFMILSLDGPIVECFDLEVPANRASSVCEPILMAMERLSVPMAK